MTTPGLFSWFDHVTTRSRVLVGIVGARLSAE